MTLKTCSMCFSKSLTLSVADTRKYVRENTLVAKKPIKVFKNVFRPVKGKVFTSLWTNFRYHAGYHYYLTTPLKPVLTAGLYLKVNEGFHSWLIEKGMLERQSVYMAQSQCLVECIIPTGSRYCQNGSLIVSDNLIFTGKIIKPTKNGSKTNYKRRKKRP